MLEGILHMNNNTKEYYGLKLLVSLSLLLLLLAYTSFYLMQHYYSNSFLSSGFNTQKIYFLQSKTLKNMYTNNGMDYENYQQRIKTFQKYSGDYGYASNIINIDNLDTLDKNSIIVALDMMVLTNNEIAKIENFVLNGGSLLFNFTAGFLNKSLIYQEDNLVSRLTPLQLDQELGSIQYDANSTGYISTRMHSVLTQHLPSGRAHELTIYDPLPIFITPKNLQADAYLTNWSQTNYLYLQKHHELRKNQSGLLWHGYQGKGKWVYFSFPSYAFMDSNKKSFINLYKGILDFFSNEIIAQPYPYIDTKNGIFVSEDSEYKFQSIKQFYDAAQQYNFPVTAFCVANLAEKYPLLMKEIASDPNFEIASHSFSHKKILGGNEEFHIQEIAKSKKVLQGLTGQEIIGFRPPREELDDMMMELLGENAYKYILFDLDNRLSPYMKNEILIIPRHATDDYSYLINANWNSKEVLQSIQHETDVIISLDGLFTLSTHTHLMNYGSNITILKNYFKYIKHHKNMHPMNGKMIYKRIKQKMNLSYATKLTSKNLVLTISNNNLEVVKNLHFDLTHSPYITINKAESEIIGTKIELTHPQKTIDTINIDTIQPKSQIVLFLNYVKTD